MNPEYGSPQKLRKATGILILIAGIFISAHCSGRDIEQESFLQLPAGLKTILVPDSITTDLNKKGNIAVDIHVPAGKGDFAGDVLVLPGWNFSRKEWQTQTRLLKIAEVKKLRLVFPEMLKTLYESQYFPETRMRWAPAPGSQWIKELLIPELRKYGLFMPGGRNFLLGLSTGGRGVALIALSNPGLFTAGAALSGDFNQAEMPADRLMSAVYGPFSQFKERWTGIDNPRSMIEKWTMPIYLGHGKRDAVVPFAQTSGFYKALTAAHPDLCVKFSAPENAGHDFNYWSSEVEPAIDFFLSAP